MLPGCGVSDRARRSSPVSTRRGSLGPQQGDVNKHTRYRQLYMVLTRAPRALLAPQPASTVFCDERGLGVVRGNAIRAPPMLTYARRCERTLAAHLGRGRIRGRVGWPSSHLIPTSSVGCGRNGRNGSLFQKSSTTANTQGKYIWKVGCRRLDGSATASQVGRLFSQKAPVPPVPPAPIPDSGGGPGGSSAEAPTEPPATGRVDGKTIAPRMGPMNARTQTRTAGSAAARHLRQHDQKIP
jgi:hypothetical protein